VPVSKEIELKLEVPSGSAPRLAKTSRLRALKTPAKSTTEISVYFDTESRAEGGVEREQPLVDEGQPTVPEAAAISVFDG